MGLFGKFVKVNEVDFGDDFTNAVYLKGKYDGIDQEQLNSAYISVLSAGIMALSYAVIRRATNKRNKEINERFLKNECMREVLADVEGDKLDYSPECAFEELLEEDK